MTQEQAHAVRERLEAVLHDSAKYPQLRLPEMQRARIREALALLPESPEPQGWQPIETAPKDRSILAYLETDRTAIVEWNAQRSRWHEVGVSYYNPTAWMPLPSPPKETP